MIKKKISYENYAPQANFFMKQNAQQARLIKQYAPQAGFFDSWVLCPVNAVFNFFPQITTQNLLLLLK